VELNVLEPCDPIRQVEGHMAPSRHCVIRQVSRHVQFLYHWPQLSCDCTADQELSGDLLPEPSGAFQDLWHAKVVFAEQNSSFLVKHQELDTEWKHHRAEIRL